MDTNYISLLNLAYEIEGLLLLHINRGEEASPEMTELLKKKIAELSAACPTGTDNNSPETVPVAHKPVQAAQEQVSIADDEEYNDDFVTDETNVPAEAELAPASECRAAMEEATEADNAAVAESATFEEMEDAEPETPVRLEDKLSRERAKDIFKAFTLNDKFRFRRELFRNSQDEFDETLDVISQMNTFDEAEEYFYNDLCWDADNEDVKEFMDTVRKHF